MEDQFNGDFDDKPTPGSSQKIRGSYQPPSVSTAMPTTSTSSESNGGESSVESIKTKSVSWANTMLQMVSLSPTPLDSSSSRGKVVKGGYERLPTELTDSDMELGKSSQFLSTNNNTSSNLSSSNNPVVSRVTNLTNFIRDTLAKEDDDSQL